MEKSTPEEIKEWLGSKVTRWYFEVKVAKKREQDVEWILNGGTLGNPEYTAMATARAVGEIQCIDQLSDKEWIVSNED